MTEDPSTPDDAQRPEGEPRFSFTDKRKVNPEDGSIRPSGDTPAAEGQGSGEPVDPIDAEAAELFDRAAQGGDDSAPADAGRVAEVEGRVTELTEQLKRDQAEYVNSRRRIEASGEVSKEAAIAGVLASLIGVLDDVELGREHGDSAEGSSMRTLAQKVEEVLGSHGLKRVGAVAEEFDSNLHDAQMHKDADDVETNTISIVMQPGY